MSHSSSTSTEGILRPASLADVDGMAEIWSTTLDPSRPWKEQYRDQFPEESLRYKKMVFEHLLDPSYEDWEVMVVEAPSIEDASMLKIVAVAVWNLSYINKGKQGKQYQGKNAQVDVSKKFGVRPDVDLKRHVALAEAESKATRALFDDIYGEKQLRLRMLHVHPLYMRRKFGTKLAQWGVSVAEKERVAVTVIASPMGALFYPRLGFKDLGGLVVQVPGETDSPEERFMALEIGL